MNCQQSTSLETLFKAGDANQDGVLTFNEFREIIESADSSVSEKQALRMFRETLQVMSGEGDSISPAAFATVAYSNGIRATPAVIFELLKKTWLQVSLFYYTNRWSMVSMFCYWSLPLRFELILLVSDGNIDCFYEEGTHEP